MHLDLDPLLPFPRWHEHAAVVEEPVRKIAGVASAHVEGSLGRLVVEIEDDADADDVLERCVTWLNAVAADLAAAGPEPQIRTAPFADPGNPLAVLVPLTAAAFDAGRDRCRGHRLGRSSCPQRQRPPEPRPPCSTTSREWCPCSSRGWAG